MSKPCVVVTWALEEVPPWYSNSPTLSNVLVPIPFHLIVTLLVFGTCVSCRLSLAVPPFDPDDPWKISVSRLPPGIGTMVTGHDEADAPWPPGPGQAGLCWMLNTGMLMPNDLLQEKSPRLMAAYTVPVKL